VADRLTGEKQVLSRAFDRVAASYDRMTVLNPSYFRHLRRSARRLGLRPTARILDLCCGTGRSTEALVRTYPAADVVALDASEGMLAVARGKRWSPRVRFVLGDATDPGAAGCGGPYDGILMAYGIRNVPDPDRCLANLLDLLAPGGAICFHEYSVADSRRARLLWQVVSRAVIAPLGVLTARETQIYRYLRKSVMAFDGVRAFEARLRRAGFVEVRTEPMDGWQRGIVHSFLGRRPS
jgi:ubiquinone/menaquinone biosynthesis C-methylase UbiE